MCISPFGPSLRPSSLVILFIHSAFSLCFLVAIFSYKNVRCLWRPVVGIFLCHAFPVFGRIFFRSFWMSCFVCIVLPFVDISLIAIISPELSGSFPKVVLLFFSCCLFHSVPSFPGSFYFTILACFRRFFLSAFTAEFPILVLTVSSSLLWGYKFSHRLISPPHRLVRLILLYYSFIPGHWPSG